MVKIHAIQTGTVAVKTRQREGVGQGLMRQFKTLTDTKWTDPLPIYVWVIEHPEGVIVIDTGETARATQRGYFTVWHPYFRLGVREWVQTEDEIGVQLERIGIAPSDVRWVVMTHLHTDHSGGLAHFSNSEIVLARAEYDAAQGFRGQVSGYLPQHIPKWFKPVLLDHPTLTDGTFGAPIVLTKAGDVRIVSTPGHTVGHQSVLFEQDGLTCFFAGDTSYTQDTMIRQAIDGVSPDENAARATLARILAFARGTPTVYLPTHDPDSKLRLENRVTVFGQAPMPSELN
ncbi:MAG: N-acyl homoserine lactonase family protein [Chloroflexota bacterium]|nr:N-acyl homoserine lactonase family protein [Chloroflexota bacterium]